MTCPNCGRPLPSTASICPNCGWERTPSMVWPPSIAHDVPPPIKRVNWLLVTIQATLGLALGAILTFFGTVLILIGPIIAGTIFSSTRRSSPYFANGVLTGIAVGLIGVAWCFDGFRRPP